MCAETVQALRTALADGEWHTARELLKHGLDERALRVVVEHHCTEFITGNKGYRLLTPKTADEACQCAARLRSQGRKMIERATRLEAAAHRIIHARPERSGSE